MYKKSHYIVYTYVGSESISMGTISTHFRKGGSFGKRGRMGQKALEGASPVSDILFLKKRYIANKSKWLDLFKMRSMSIYLCVQI